MVGEEAEVEKEGGGSVGRGGARNVATSETDLVCRVLHLRHPSRLPPWTQGVDSPKHGTVVTINSSKEGVRLGYVDGPWLQ